MTEQTQDANKGMAWWNGLPDEKRKEWMARAGNTGVAADAWAAFKAHSQSLAELCEVAKRGYNGDRSADAELRRLGECLAMVGGFELMAKLQGAMHDHEIEHQPALYSLSGYMGSNWEHIPAWANA